MARDGWTKTRKKTTSFGPVTGALQYHKPGDDQVYAGLPAVARAYYPDLVAVAPRPAPARRQSPPATRAPLLRILDHVSAPFKGSKARYAGIVVGVGRGTVDVHFLDGDFAAGVEAAAVYTGRRPRVGPGPPIALGARVAELSAPATLLVVVAFDDAYAVCSGTAGNRAFQRDVLRSFVDRDGDSSDDDAAPTAPPLDAEDNDDEALDDAPAAPMDDDDDALAVPPAPDAATEAPAVPLFAVDETVLVGKNKDVATVQRATRAGENVVLVRWENTAYGEQEVDVADVEKLDLAAGRSRRSSAAPRERAPAAAAVAVTLAAAEAFATADVLRHGTPAGDLGGRRREQAPLPQPDLEAKI